MKVIDAEHFLKERFDFVKKTSLEGCPSALIWLPENSDIWKTYGSRMNCVWMLSLGRRRQWSLCEMVLEQLIQPSSLLMVDIFCLHLLITLQGSGIQPQESVKQRSKIFYPSLIVNCLLQHFLLVFSLPMLLMANFISHHVHLSLTHLEILYFTLQTFKKLHSTPLP